MANMLRCGMFLAAAVVCHAAQAGMITDTTGVISISNLDLSAGDAVPPVDLPLFDANLGPLTSVAIVLTASLQSTVTDLTGQPHAPALVPATVGMGVIGAASFGRTDHLTVLSNGLTASVADIFSLSYVATDANDANDFTRFNSFTLAPYVFIADLAGADTEDSTSIRYQISETFAYVPEPASWALFGAGLLGLWLAVRTPPRVGRPADARRP